MQGCCKSVFDKHGTGNMNEDMKKKPKWIEMILMKKIKWKQDKNP